MASQLFLGIDCATKALSECDVKADSEGLPHKPANFMGEPPGLVLVNVEKRGACAAGNVGAAVDCG